MSDLQYLSLRITRAEPEEEAFDSGYDGDWLKIVQPEYKKPSTSGTGFTDWMTINNRGLSIDSILSNLAAYQSQCDGNGDLTIELQIFKSRPALAYTMKASYGKLSGRYVHQTAHKESKTVNQTDNIDLQMQITGTLTVAWEGDVMGMDGSTLFPKPKITAVGSKLSWPVKVYAGVLRLSYQESHDAYTLTITPREPGDYEADDPEGAYQSTVFATWAGGVETHDIDLPEMDGNCSGGNFSKGSGDDDDEKCYKHFILVDPCTKEVIKEWDEEAQCPEDKVRQCEEECKKLSYLEQEECLKKCK